MIRVADVHGHSWEGSINKQNYLKLFTHQQVDERQDGIEEAFTFIAKGDSELDKEAIRNIFEALGEKTTDEEINELMDLGDLDDDGYIGLEDFKNMCNAPDPKDRCIKYPFHELKGDLIWGISSETVEGFFSI